MTPALLIIPAALLVLTGIVVMLVRFLSTKPKWQQVSLPGYAFYVARDDRQPADEQRTAHALLLAIESLQPIYGKEAIRIAMEMKPLHVLIMSAESWLNIGGIRIGGEQEQNYLRVNPSLTSLCHELIHYLQWTLEEFSDPSHTSWGGNIWHADEAYRAALQ